MLGNVGATLVSAATVSAQVVRGSAATFGSVSANSINGSAASFLGKVDAATVSAQAINGSAANFSTVSAQTFTGSAANFSTVSAQRVTTSGATILGTVSAATVHVNTLIMNADTSIAAVASASKYVLVTVSGVAFWMALYRAS